MSHFSIEEGIIKRDCLTAIAVGNFDGMHSGHRQLLSRLKEEAAIRQLQTAVVTFFPHPRAITSPDECPPMIQNRQQRIQALQDSGVDHVVALTFDKQFANCSPESFVHQLLIRELNARILLIGADFRFGPGRTAGLSELVQLTESTVLRIVPLPVLRDQQIKISSSYVRELLKNAQISEANRMLAAPYVIQASVVKGAGIGRSLGYPTINLHLYNDHILPTGIYAGWVHDGISWHKAAISYGFRPTIESIVRDRLMEAYIFQYNRSIYGQLVQVQPVLKIRDEAKFDDLQQLKQQIGLDVQKIEAILRHHSPETGTRSVSRETYHHFSSRDESGED